MREIKFRAWDKEDKRMIIDEQDFIPVKVTNKGVLRMNPHHKENFWEFIDEERFEIMQYTGLKDKNGKEIYEGDIILFNNFGDTLDKVVYSSGCFRTSGRGYLLDKIREIEIIGNIYEHPHLLKEGVTL